MVNESLKTHEDINAWDLSCKLTDKMNSLELVEHPQYRNYVKFLLSQTDSTLEKNLKIFCNSRYLNE